MPYLDLKDIKLYYEAYGEGPPFLFISETACDGAVWKLFQVPEFSRDHRVINFDYRGTGLSGKPSVKIPPIYLSTTSSLSWTIWGQSRLSCAVTRWEVG